ncbi:hypothetical protein [Aequorivita sp. Q41]|uniref:hypothetical protein n=1 Tax=Aequorivita sp. Q41 TaxID=3153300 RepID=UPI003242B4AD
MRLSSIFLLIVFTSFLVTPAIITISGNQADVSTFFSMNEEENSVKLPKLVSEYQVNDLKSSLAAIQFLKQQKNNFQYYLNNYKMVFLDVVSPPPKLA